MHPSNVWKAANEGGRRFIEEGLIEFAWLAKQDSTSAVRPVPSANCKKKIANRKAAITQHKNAVHHKINENAVAGVGRLNFPGADKSVTTEVRKVEIELADSPRKMTLLNSNLMIIP